MADDEAGSASMRSTRANLLQQDMIPDDEGPVKCFCCNRTWAEDDANLRRKFIEHLLHNNAKCGIELLKHMIVNEQQTSAINLHKLLCKNQRTKAMNHASAIVANKFGRGQTEIWMKRGGQKRKVQEFFACDIPSLISQHKRALVDFFAGHALAYRLVDSLEFKEVLSTACMLDSVLRSNKRRLVDHEMVNRRQLSQLVHQRAKDIRRERYKQLSVNELLQYGVSFDFDGLKKHHRRFVGLNLVNMRSEQTFFISAPHVSGFRETATWVASTMDSIMTTELHQICRGELADDSDADSDADADAQEVEEGQVLLTPDTCDVTITVDGASNARGAALALQRDRYPLLKVLWCQAHVMHLVFSHASNVAFVETLMRDCIKLQRYFCGRASVLRETWVAKVNEQKKNHPDTSWSTLSIAVETRWLTKLRTMQDVLGSWSLIVSLSDSAATDGSGAPLHNNHERALQEIQRIVNKPTFQADLRAIVDLFDPIKDALRFVDQGNAFIGDVYPVWAQCIEWAQVQQQQLHPHAQQLAEVAAELESQLRHYRDRAHDPVYSASYMLAPKHRSAMMELHAYVSNEANRLVEPERFELREQEYAKLREDLLSEAVRLEKMEINRAAAEVDVERELTSAKMKVMLAWKAYVCPSSANGKYSVMHNFYENNGRSELTASEEWWFLQTDMQPLQKVASHAFNTACVSSRIERVWSALDRVLVKRRLRLSEQALIDTLTVVDHVARCNRDIKDCRSDVLYEVPSAFGGEWEDAELEANVENVIMQACEAESSFL